LEKDGAMTDIHAAAIVELFLLALPVASVSWTITHEELFREPRDWCARRSEASRAFLPRKFFFALTCEFCLSHYVALFFICLTRFQLIAGGWRGYLIAWFSLVWIANFYMGLYGRLRLDITHERVEIRAEEQAARAEQEGRAPRT
jgi:hypothetical protein